MAQGSLRQRSLSDLVLPETNELVERVLQFPTGTAVDMEQIDIICQILNTVLANGPQISSLLNEQDALGKHPLETESHSV